MVDPAAFGGSDIEVDSVNARELTSPERKKTSFSREITEEGPYEEDIDLPASWLEGSPLPVQAVENKVEDQVYGIMSLGSENDLGMEREDLDACIRAAYPEENNSRIVSEVFFPVDEYELPNGTGSEGVVSYSVQLTSNTESWKSNAQEELFQYREVDEVEGENVWKLLFDGMYEDEERHMRPEWDSDDEVTGYDGSIALDYSNPM